MSWLEYLTWGQWLSVALIGCLVVYYLYKLFSFHGPVTEGETRSILADRADRLDIETSAEAMQKLSDVILPREAGV